MAFPNTSVLDNFNRANGALGANWAAPIRPSNASGFLINTNAAKVSTVNSSTYWTTTSFTASVATPVEVYAKIPTWPGSGAAIYYCIQNAGGSSVNAYFVLANVATDAISLIKVTADAESTLNSTTGTVTAGDQFGVSFDGTTHTVYQNGTVVFTQTDSTYTSGKLGIWGSNSSTTFDDFGGGNVSAPASFPTFGVIDNFNRADQNPIAGNWTNTIVTGDASLKILTNTIRAVSGTASAYYNVQRYAAPLEVYGTVPTLGSAGTAFHYCIANPASGSRSGYLVTHNATGTLSIKRVDANVETTLATTSSDTINAGDVYGIRFDGTTHIAYRQGTEIIRATDNTYSNGWLGIFISSTTTIVDDFGGGGVAVSASGGPPSRSLLGVGS